ncbi:uncharacterized protein LOC108682990 [Hyalella azteca]|uniref:Uncharacterized protein LOC108682990 n=1 Tax=Hyalella azteca TaxID=294128 RepID=A0A8B7PQK3_HYAAZ|nr:uncharacterized protein LOC108682990 [Hyalella azteca]
MFKERWKQLVAFTFAVLHITIVLGQPSETASLHSENGMQLAEEMPISYVEFQYIPSYGDIERQGYFTEQRSNGGFMGFISDSAKYITDIFSGSVSSPHRSQSSVDERAYRLPPRAVQSRFTPDRSGPDFTPQRFRSHPMGPPRFGGRRPPFLRHSRHPPRENRDSTEDLPTEKPGFWTGGYSSHFKTIDVDSPEHDDNYYDPVDEENLIDRRYTGSQNWPAGNSNLVSKGDLSEDKLIDLLTSNAYRLRLPLETIDTRGADAAPKNYGRFSWPDSSSREGNEKRNSGSKSSHQSLFNRNFNSQASLEATFKAYQRGNSYDADVEEAIRKWEEWGKLIGKSTSTNTKQNNIEPIRSANTVTTAPVKQTRYTTQTVRNNISTIGQTRRTRHENNFAVNAKVSHKSFVPSNVQSTLDLLNINNNNQPNNRNKLVSSNSTRLVLTDSGSSHMIDKKYEVSNVVDALKIVVDALENSASGEKIYLKKPQAQQPTILNYQLASQQPVQQSKLKHFGEEWTPLF